MIDNHYLPAPDEIPPEEIRTLPDRTNLSDLYPDSSSPELAQQRRLNERLRESINGRLIRSLSRRALVVGILGPLPVLVGLLAMSYLIPVVGVNAIS